jgi:hypothetical protein
MPYDEVIAAMGLKSTLGSKNLDSTRLKFLIGSKTGVPSWTSHIKNSLEEVGFKAIYVVGISVDFNSLSQPEWLAGLRNSVLQSPCWQKVTGSDIYYRLKTQHMITTIR